MSTAPPPSLTLSPLAAVYAVLLARARTQQQQITANDPPPAAGKQEGAGRGELEPAKEHQS